MPEESSIQTLVDLAGATRRDRVSSGLRASCFRSTLRSSTCRGSVEIAPRLGLADAIVDLVSSGSTLRTNGLRSLGVLLESEAVLVARDDEAAAPFAAMLRAVVQARDHRYLMLNAPESALAAITALVSPRVPSVLPLAEPGMVAVHALVPAATSGASCPSSKQPAARRS